jgi:MazG family protein
LNDKTRFDFDALVAVVRRLRGENGCPWDNEQTLQSVGKYLLEETHEAIDAIRSGDMKALAEELGDVLWLILFMARIAEQQGAFTPDQMIQRLGEKMVRRHPHIFGGESAKNSDEVVAKWADIKKAEGRARSHADVLENVARSLPALARAQRVGERAAKAGYDWKDIRVVLEKAAEEIQEWREAAIDAESARAHEEFGDLLFALSQAARHMGLSAEDALHKAADKFISRFRIAEEIAAQQGGALEDMSPEELDDLWEKVKRL